MTERLTGKIPGLYGNVSDEEGAFVYWCYVSSRFFDEHVRPERTGFDAIERRDELFSASELSLDDVRDTVLERAESHLSTVLSKNRLRSRERIMRFVAQQAPKYRFLLFRVPDRDLNIDPEITDKELELALHRHYADLERKLLRDGQDVIRAVEGGQEREYQERLAEYMSNVEEFKMSDLASYVTHRRVTIELFEKAIEKRPDGTYAHEELIHSLIMSRGSDSDEISLRNCNLWLIDERLSFHHYLSSDKPIGSMPITGSDSRKRPDICALRILDDPVLVSPGKMPHASLDIIEIKRPMRADVGAGKEYDPIEQAIGYLRRIRVGKVFTAHGRAISSSKTLPGFCYIIADLTENLRVRCEDHHDLQVTSDGLGYFGYKSNVNAYIEVTSFDRVVQRAKERNRAFFDQLGLPVT